MTPTCDAIIIPGGGLREDGELNSWVQRRLERAIELHGGQFIIIASAGTTHRATPLDNAGFPIFESVAAARYLIEAGIAAESILTETCSYDTIGNAFFTRVIHAEPRLLRRLLVITSDFHVARTEAVFNWVYSLEPRPCPYELRFESVADASMDEEILHARREKERTSLDALQNLLPRFTRMEDFHRWLFTEHGAYRAAPSFGSAGLDELTLQSY